MENEFLIYYKHVRSNIINNNKKIKLMIIKKNTIIHDNFSNIYKYFNKKDIIIYNNINSYKSVIIGNKKNIKNKIKVTLLKKIKKNIWEIKISPAKKIRINNKIIFYIKKKKVLTLQIIDNTNFKYRIAKFIFNKQNIKKIINKIGKYYLPKYINFSKFNEKKYINFFNKKKKKKSIILPTENIYFNDKIFLKMKIKKIKFLKIYSLINKKLFNNKKINILYEYFKIFPKTKKFLDKKKKIFTAIGIDVLKIIENNFKKKKYFNIKKWQNNISNLNYNFNIINNLLTNLHINVNNYNYIKFFIKNINLKKIYNLAKKNKYKFGLLGDYILIKK